MLAACWQSSSPPPRSSPPSSSSPRPPVDAAADARLIADEPPPADAGAPAAASGPPTLSCPNGIIARVIALNVQGAGTMVTIAAGSSRGVQMAWTATLGTARAPMQLQRVDTNKSIALVTVTPDQIRAQPYVELCPP